jgi:hypothetical protein
MQILTNQYEQPNHVQFILQFWQKKVATSVNLRNENLFLQKLIFHVTI